MGAGLAAFMAMNLAACGGAASQESPGGVETASEEGKVFHIYSWDESFKDLFEAYYADKVPEGVQVKWTIVPSEEGAYEESLDNALLEQADLADDEKVDLFLAEEAYVLKYVNSEVTQDVKALGMTDLSNAYDYTVQVCTNEEGITKGVAYQCCPSALIYRRSIAKEVLGTDDPLHVQEAVSDWDKFETVADAAKEKGYLITASFAETYRAFFSQASIPWVVEDSKLQIDEQVEAWIDQTKRLVACQATLMNGFEDDAYKIQMCKDGQTMCFFGPDWFIKGNMMDPENPDHACAGDWAICPGPADYFQGGCWLLAAAGSDNPGMLADIMNTFLNNKDVCEKLVSAEHLFCNNQAVMERYGADLSYGNDFLGGQNDLAVYDEIARGISFDNRTFYDEVLNEGLQDRIQAYFQGDVSKEEAMVDFYSFVNDQYPMFELP